MEVKVARVLVEGHDLLLRVGVQLGEEGALHRLGRGLALVCDNGSLKLHLRAGKHTIFGTAKYHCVSLSGQCMHKVVTG